MRCLMGCLLFCSVTAHANSWYSETHLSTSASSRLSGENRLTTQVHSARLKAEYSGNIDIRFDGQWQYDSVYDAHSNYSQQAEDEYQQRLWIDEAYIQWPIGQYELSLGYQKVVWGQADDLRVTDVINPLDLKDFVLFDIDDYRISLPLLRLERSVGDWQLQGLWILDSKANQLPPEGSEFTLNIPALPESDTDDTEVGVKAEGLWGSSDLAFYAFYGYSDSPVVDSQSNRLQLDKETMLGTSLASPVGNWILRSELAWFNDRALNTQSVDIVERDVVQWLFGADYLYKDWLFTLQSSDRRIENYSNDLSIEKSEPILTLSGDATLLSGTMNLRLAASYLEDTHQGQLYQIKTRYRPFQQWEFGFNIDVLEGHSDNFFGQFDNNDRVWLSATYTL